MERARSFPPPEEAAAEGALNSAVLRRRIFGKPAPDTSRRLPLFWEASRSAARRFAPKRFNKARRRRPEREGRKGFRTPFAKGNFGIPKN
ncbi:MAG: hypothetical protein DBY30_00710 [Verrucomicrobia bacterium]|nr:MAG: hypothetical protein DBY30_00710 [Verrucomicrobiota bacterium]